ncbi:MAG: AAA family ATPase [Pirellulaceae bacterium]
MDSIQQHTGSTTALSPEQLRAHQARTRQQQRREFKALLNEEDVRKLDLSLDPDDVDEQPDDLVSGGLGGGSAGLVLAHHKDGKSSTMTDLAVCLSSHKPTKFLGYFDVCEHAFHVVYLDFENTVSESRDRVRRAATARGVLADPDRLHVIQGFPPLDDDAGLNKLDRILSHLDEGVCIVDCLYAALPQTDFTRLNSIGGVLADISNACRENNVTPLYVHHAKAGRVTSLQSASGCGVAEHVGQWMLLDRVGTYAHETGGSRYRMEIGSRAGFGGRYTLQVTEGRLSDPGGRRWETVVTPIAAKVVTADDSADCGDDGKLINAVLTAISEKPVTQSVLRAATKRSGNAVSKAVDQLLQAGKIVPVEVKVRGNSTTGYRLADVGRTLD